MLCTVRWGILGCGDVTERKSGPALQKATSSELVAVMRRNAVLARDYAARHGVPRWYSDPHALISDPGVDAVYIATPPSSHAELAIACARAGKPTYVEKPMAMTGAECDAMLDAFHAAGVPLFVAYYRRALPRFLEIKRGVEAHRIGEPRHVHVRLCKRPSPPPSPAEPTPWRLVPELSGGGRFVDLACHTLDVLDDLLGPICRVSGIAVNQGTALPVEDAVAACFAFASGAIGTGSWCFTAPAPDDEVTIIGTRGEVSFSTFGTDITWTRDGAVDRVEIPNPEHIQQPLIQSIVDELLGRGHCPSTAESGARTTRVIDTILAERRSAHGAGFDSRDCSRDDQRRSSAARRLGTST